MMFPFEFNNIKTYLHCTVYVYYISCICSQSLLKRFIKEEILNDITALQMVRLDTTDKKARKQLKNVDIGLGAEAVIKVFWQISNNG